MLPAEAGKNGDINSLVPGRGPSIGHLTRSSRCDSVAYRETADVNTSTNTAAAAAMSVSLLPCTDATTCPVHSSPKLGGGEIRKPSAPTIPLAPELLQPTTAVTNGSHHPSTILWLGAVVFNECP
eukprot:1389252-Rhodomonas_salina.1